jgi:Beta-lactamase superfamily domain
MSVTVKHLNADSSFLLLFSPDAQPSSPQESNPLNTTYSILIDPWVQGPSIVTAPWFAITKRVIPACVQHLSELDEPDVVIISQNKPDHCHGETLRQLRPEGKTIIAAEPGAAKAIKSWNHFDPARVLALPKFDPHRKFSYATFYIPPLSPGGHRGTVTVSFIPAKNYMTGLHNAIGITYLAPTHTKSVASVPTVDLRKRTQYFHLPLSRATSMSPTSASQTKPLTAASTDHRPSTLDRPLTAGAGVYRPRLSQGFGPISPVTPRSQKFSYSPPPIFASDDDSPSSTFSTYSRESTSDTSSIVNVAFQPNNNEFLAHPLPTPPQSPADPSSTTPFTGHTPRSSSGSQPFINTSPVTAGRPRPLSILYTPHGIPFKPDLMPYVKTHLVQRGALPLTVLLHSFHRATNPWYLGGNITAGTEGGVEIARGLMARCWLSAHDEAKDDQGVSVKKLKTSRMSPDEVRRALWAGPEGEEMRRKGWNCDVRSLAAGQEMVIGQSRDLLSGLENKRESRLMRFGPPPPLPTTTTTSPLVTTEDLSPWSI